MEPWQWGGVALVALLLALAAWERNRSNRSLEAFDRLIDEVTLAEQQESEDQDAPRAIDPENPPRWMTYAPKSPGTLVCSCHGERFAPGDQVLIWPIPNHPESGCDLFCIETMNEARG